MAPTQSKHSKKATTKNGTRLLKPAISLKRLEKTKEGKQKEKIECRNNPSDADSTTYKIPMVYFRDRTSKEWLLFKNKLAWCMAGQNVTDRATKYTLARQLLARRALADFNHAAMVNGNESLANYMRCISAVILGFFPQKALQDQKRLMRRFLKKPSAGARLYRLRD